MQLGTMGHLFRGDVGGFILLPFSWESSPQNAVPQGRFETIHYPRKKVVDLVIRFPRRTIILTSDDDDDDEDEDEPPAGFCLGGTNNFSPSHSWAV